MLPFVDPAQLHPFQGLDIRCLVDAQAERRGTHPFLIWAPFEGDEQTWTYGDFRRLARALGAGLAARGARPGDRILVHLDNCLEAALAWIGCAYGGFTAVTTNTKSAAGELSYFADHCQVVGAITQPAYAELVGAACPGLKWLCVTQGPSRDSFEALLGDPNLFQARPVDPLAEFSIQFTSGTTSRPKAVLWSHANALWGARINAVHEDLRAEDVHLVSLPLFHTNAQAYSVLAALWAGATAVITPRFSASRFWPTALRHRCTWASIIPFCERALADQEVPSRHHFRLWGSAYCEPPTDAQFGVKTIGWWGMSETITHGIVGTPHLQNAPYTIGRPAPEYAIHVVNDAGRPVQPGETGDLLVGGIPGISLFAGYLGDENATAASYDEAGRFRTGDRVTLVADGSLVFADRTKDMLKVGGENVAASEIERVIILVPGVGEVAVVAKAHPMLDEVPVAFVIPKGGVDAGPGLADRILAACRHELATFKVPAEVRLVDALPRSTLEKVAKNELRKLLG
jgi:crotonobetaine/carnitine-CoA ligase